MAQDNNLPQRRQSVEAQAAERVSEIEAIKQQAMQKMDQTRARYVFTIAQQQGYEKRRLAREWERRQELESSRGKAWKLEAKLNTKFTTWVYRHFIL